jgi:hypothetical protein
MTVKAVQCIVEERRGQEDEDKAGRSLYREPGL